MKTKTHKRKNHRRRTYKGGLFEADKTYCNKKAPIEPFKKLYDHVDTKKYSRGFTTYGGGGCDLFIWVKKIKDPHIHVHGFTDSKFSYTISGLGIRNQSVELPSPTEEGYKYVLDEMCSQLTKRKHVPTSKVFETPERTVSASEPPITSTKKLPNKLLIADIFKDIPRKLGPIMGKEMMKKEASLLEE
jgi:hypothetical protein